MRTFDLLRREDEPHMAEEQEDPRAPSPIRILVADDSATMRHLIGVMLSRYYLCDITEAVDGADAYSRLSNGTFDLLVTDVNMPRMTGLALVKKIREEQKNSIPVIIVTTMGAARDQEKGMEMGADAYITKPVNGYRLAEKVGALLYGYRRQTGEDRT
jgi:two-component system chemotaxis response regulator CheY